MPTFLARALLVCVALLSLETQADPCRYLLEQQGWRKSKTTAVESFVVRGADQIESLLKNAGDAGPGLISNLFKLATIGGGVVTGVTGWPALVETVASGFEHWSQWVPVGKSAAVMGVAAFMIELTSSQIDVFFSSIRYGLRAPLELRFNSIEGARLDKKGRGYYYRFEIRPGNGNPIFIGYRQLIWNDELKDGPNSEAEPVILPVYESNP